MKRAVKDNLKEFIAIIVLFLIGLATTGVILAKQQAPYPDWIPVLGDDTFELEAEFETAQAVIPGQGQTVNLSGIKVGDVTETHLDEGNAVVTMLIEQQYAPLIHEDATLLLRPRTGLQDMTIEVDPGTPGSPPVEEGSRIVQSQTAPNVNPDQILASLDGDTQDFLKLLVQAGGEGLGGRGKELSAGLRRFEPLARDLKRINGALAKRREAIARGITALKEVSATLASEDAHLADFVDSSDAALGSFANQEAAIREALQEFPSALTATRSALESGERFAEVLGPSSTALLPSAEALKPALEATQPFFAKTLGPIKDQIRPFTREVRPAVTALAGTTKELNNSAPALTNSLAELNRLFNALGYNPPGVEEGFLFWAGWLSHNTNGLFTQQSADGPMRRALVVQSCQTINLANGVATSFPKLATLIQVSRIPNGSEVCPLEPGP